MKKMTLFDHLNALTVDKVDYNLQNDVQTKSYSPYMINRFISMIDIYIPIVNEINRYDVPKDVHYRYYQSAMPKRKHYFRYISPKKEVDEKTRELLCEYFECANGELECHLQILTAEQIQKIVDVYKHRV